MKRIKTFKAWVNMGGKGSIFCRVKTDYYNEPMRVMYESDYKQLMRELKELRAKQPKRDIMHEPTMTAQDFERLNQERKEGEG